MVSCQIKPFGQTHLPLYFNVFWQLRAIADPIQSECPDEEQQGVASSSIEIAFADALAIINERRAPLPLVQLFAKLFIVGAE